MLYQLTIQTNNVGRIYLLFKTKADTEEVALELARTKAPQTLIIQSCVDVFGQPMKFYVCNLDVAYCEISEVDEAVIKKCLMTRSEFLSHT